MLCLLDVSIKYTAAISRLIAAEFEKSSDTFVRYFTSQVYSGRMTQVVRDQFTDITKWALQRFLNDRINDLLTSAMQAAPVAAAPTPEQPAEAKNGEEADVKRQVTTTAEEMEGFFAVKSVLRGVVDVKRVRMLDTKSYCGILLDDNNRLPICRWKQAQHNRRLFEKDAARERRQRDVDRILDYLDEYATLAQLYRVLARAENRLVTDANGRPLKDSEEAYQVIEREVFADENLESALIELEGKDTHSSIRLQSLRVFQQLSEIGDLLLDFDPSGEAQNQLDLLYYFSTEGLSSAVRGGKFQELVNGLHKVDTHRTALRTLVKGFVDPPGDTSHARHEKRGDR